MNPSNDTNVLTEDHREKNGRKSIRKQKRAHHRLLRDMNIKCSDEPTQVSINNYNLFYKQILHIEALVRH